MPYLESAIGMLASTLSFVMFWPQAYRTWRDRHHRALMRAVSVGTYSLLLINSLAWALYAALTGAVWIALPSAFNLPMALLVLTLAARARRPDLTATALRQHA